MDKFEQAFSVLPRSGMIDAQKVLMHPNAFENRPNFGNPPMLQGPQPNPILDTISWLVQKLMSLQTNPQSPAGRGFDPREP